MSTWHSVKDKMPELVRSFEEGERFSKNVIGFTSDGYFEIVSYEESPYFIGWRIVSSFAIKTFQNAESDIIAWCEIPEIPEELLEELLQEAT